MRDEKLPIWYPNTRIHGETHGKREQRNTPRTCAAYLPKMTELSLVLGLRYVFTWSNIECCGIWLDTSPTGFIYTSLDLNYPRDPNSSKYLLRRCFRSILGVQLASDQVFGCLGLYEPIWPFPWMVWNSQFPWILSLW